MCSAVFSISSGELFVDQPGKRNCIRHPAYPTAVWIHLHCLSLVPLVSVSLPPPIFKKALVLFLHSVSVLSFSKAAVPLFMRVALAVWDVPCISSRKPVAAVILPILLVFGQSLKRFSCLN